MTESLIAHTHIDLHTCTKKKKTNPINLLLLLLIAFASVSQLNSGPRLETRRPVGLIQKRVVALREKKRDITWRKQVWSIGNISPLFSGPITAIAEMLEIR